MNRDKETTNNSKPMAYDTLLCGVNSTIIPHSNSNLDREVCPLCEGSKVSKGSFLRKCPKCKGTGKRLNAT